MPTDIFKTIRRIQIETANLAKDILAGLYRSAFKGRGIEFEEVREYQPGDEIRSIDWAVTSRMNHPYVKVFREERELTVMLLVDISASSRFGTGHKLKRELIAEISAILAFSATKNNDNVGLILFSNVVEVYLPPRNNLRHVLRVIRELLMYEPKNTGTDIAGALDFLGRVQAKSCVCFLVSDFIAPAYENAAALIARKHDLIGIGITDPNEIDLPPLALVRTQDLESHVGEVVDMSDRSLRKDFKQQAEERIKTQRHLFERLGAAFIDIRTDQPYLAALRKFFKLRSKHPR